MVIGYNTLGYPVTRNILGLCPDVTYRRTRAPSELLSHPVARRIPWSSRIPQSISTSFIWGTGLNGIDVLHFFNTIVMPPCRKPYITTFETTLPRFASQEGYWYRKGLESLASEKCRRLIAISECAYRLQRKLFDREGLSYCNDKLTVLHPPQRLLVDESVVSDRPVNREITFIFVGRQFWRKGGGESVRALARLRRHFPVRLVCVGNIDRHGYMSSPAFDKTNEMRKLLEENKHWIDFYPALPNDQVLSVMKKCDIGLLPTRADTYGFGVLEMQASGLPCITTDIRALPEINNDECGWLIPVTKDDNENAVARTPDEIALLSEVIEKGLEEKIGDLLSDSEAIKRKAVRSVQRIAAMHDPGEFGRTLSKIYAQAADGR